MPRVGRHLFDRANSRYSLFKHGTGCLAQPLPPWFFGHPTLWARSNCLMILSPLSAAAQSC